MKPTKTPTKEREPPEEKKKKSSGLPIPSGGELALPLVPLALAVWYLGWEAPELVPLPEGAKVPFPAAVGFLETVCEWCGGHHSGLLWIAGGLLVAGFVVRFFLPRYFLILAVVTSLFAGFTWYTISAPVERLINNVEENLPKR